MRRGNAPGSLACFGLAYLSDCAGVWENAGAKRTGNGSGQAAQDLDLDVGGFFVVIDCPGAGIQKGSLGHWAELGQAGHGAVQSSEPAIFNGGSSMAWLRSSARRPASKAGLGSASSCP